MKDSAHPLNSLNENQTQITSVKKFTSPVNLFIRLTVLIFITEGLAFILLKLIRPGHIWQDTLLHTFLTTTLILPILFIFSLRPLLFQITERHRAEQALQSVHLELEDRVRIRTAELFSANQTLEMEAAERKRAEQALHLQTAAVEAAANGIIITDCQGTIQWANPAFAHMTGYDLKEVVGQTPRLLKSGKHDVGYYENMWNTILSNRVWRGEITNRRKNGTLYNEEQTITPVLDSESKITHFIAIKQDISERKQAEIEQEQTNRELLAISQAEHNQRKLAEGLFQATLALNSSLDLETVLDRILDQTQRAIPYTAAAVMLKDGNTLHLMRHRGLGDIPIINTAMVSGVPLDIHPVIAKVCLERQPITISDTDQRPDDPLILGNEWVRSLSAAPMVREETVVGLIILLSDEAGFFSQEMTSLLEAFTAHAVLAINNARLYDEVRTSQERMQALSHRLVDIQESERRYVARELHDEASQGLTSLMVGLKLLERFASQPEAILAGTAELKHTLESVMENLHRLAIDLRPASLDHLGLIPALRQYAESANQKYGISVQFETVGIDQRLDLDMETALYRIAQEALINSVRHAHATRIDILLEQRGEKLVLIIEDDGVGFDPTTAMLSGRLGMFGMRERAEMVGGELVIESTEGVGTTVFVEVPVDNPHLAG